MTSVVYLACPARSGSTIVSRALNTSASVVSVGEVYQLWLEDAWNVGNSCSCGAALPACKFWSEVMSHAGLSGADFRQTRASILKASRPRSSVRVLLRRKPRLTTHAEEVVNRLYSAISAVAGAAIVVDASKFPGYADALCSCSTIEVSVVHLIRDPEGVFRSATRAKPRDDWGGHPVLPARGKFTTIAKWVTAHELIAARWGSGQNYVRVHYSDFVREPLRELERIGRSLGVTSDVELDAAGCFEVGEEHLIGSNPDRSTRGRLRIRPDSPSATSLPPRDKSLVAALTRPTRRRLGVE